MRPVSQNESIIVVRRLHTAVIAGDAMYELDAAHAEATRRTVETVASIVDVGEASRVDLDRALVDAAESAAAEGATPKRRLATLRAPVELHGDVVVRASARSPPVSGCMVDWHRARPGWYYET